MLSRKTLPSNTGAKSKPNSEMKARLFWLLPIPERGYRIIVCDFFSCGTRHNYDLNTEFFTENEIGQLMGGN